MGGKAGEGPGGDSEGGDSHGGRAAVRARRPGEPPALCPSASPGARRAPAPDQLTDA